MTTQFEDILLWLRLFLVEQLGPQKFLKSLHELGSPEQILGADAAELLPLGWTETMVRTLHNPVNFEKATREYELALTKNIQIIPFHSPLYPKNLKESPFAVPLLYCLGKLQNTDQCSVAVVGTRKASTYGLDFTQRMVRGLVDHGVCITSGLAVGIDRCAHHTCLERGGRTLAVLGQGLLTLGSKAQKEWSLPIAENGAVLSQFPLLMQGHRGSYPARNKLITGLSRFTLVTESGLQGGAMITARHCLDEGKDLGALPGPWNHKGSEGCNWLINQGAHCLTSPGSALDLFSTQRVLTPSLRKTPPEQPSNPVISKTPPPELKALWELILPPRTHLETLFGALPLTKSQIHTQLMRLEMGGFIQALPGGYFTRR